MYSFGAILAILIPVYEWQNTRNFNSEKNAPTCFRSGNGIGGDLRTTIVYLCARDRRGRPHRISRQKFPKWTRILSIPSKPHSSHSVHSAIGSRMNGMIFRSFRKRNSSQKNTITVHSEYSYSGIVPKERVLWIASISIVQIRLKLKERLSDYYAVFILRIQQNILYHDPHGRKFNIPI